MMGDRRLPDHPQPVELLNLYLGDNLQPHPGVCQRETHGQPGPPEPCGGHTWALDSPETSRPDAPARVSGVEPAHVGRCSSPGTPGGSCPTGSPRPNHSSSTQVVFWAGILQAQMCVLDLEEELEKTEGLRAELRCCVPSSSPGLPGDRDLRPSPAVEEDSGEDSSGPEGESQAWALEGAADSSPEWGAEEESLFFDNPLFLESPCSDTSASGECFSWGFSDSCLDVRTRPHSPQALEPRLLGGTGPRELGSEPDLKGSTAESSGCATPPFPVPSYKLHTSCWAIHGAPTAPAAQEGQVSSLPGLPWGHAEQGLPGATRPRTLFNAGSAGCLRYTADQQDQCGLQNHGKVINATVSAQHHGSEVHRSPHLRGAVSRDM
ncbi:Hypothetical predicted protein [Marmota monax]|uniref:Uncharacterized protein n=1 Tax=Marmota monax TaxID=9995 RepID=A0A5E4DBK9_MARMO|nr:Hypothetical predicted protein [Marmota monax]